MSVSHLGKHARIAQSAKANSGYPDSTVSTPGFAHGPSGGQGGAGSGKGTGYSAEAVRALKGPAKPAFGGGRLGAKSGQPKLGKRWSNVLGKVFPNGNAGRGGEK